MNVLGDREVRQGYRKSSTATPLPSFMTGLKNHATFIV